MKRKNRFNFRVVATILLIVANALSSQGVQASDVPQVSNHPWSALDWAGNAKWSTIDVSGDGQVIVATTEEGGLFVSNDSGENWRSIFEVGFTDVFDAEVSENGKQVSAYGGRISFHSDDAGFTWSAIPGNVSPSIRCKIIFSCAPETTFKFVKVRTHPSGILFAPGAIVVDGEFRYLTSRNWNWVSAAVSSDRRIIIATAWQWTVPGPDLATYISKDSGKTFTNAGFPRASIADVSADGSTLVLASTNGKVHVSQDLGATWKSESSPSEKQVYFTSNLQGTKLFALSPAYAGESSLLFSANSGMSWERVQVQGAVNYEDISCSEDCSNVIIRTSDATGTIRIFKSRDAGANWISLANVPSGLAGARLTLSNDGNFIIGTTYNQIYLSRDAGVTWLNYTSTQNGCLYRPIFYSSSNTLLVFNCAGEALRSVDFGTNWDSIPFIQSHITSIAASQGLIAASTTNAVYTSSDMGDSWQLRLSSPKYPQNLIFGNISISSDGRVLAVEQAGPAVLISKDAGLNWSSLTYFLNQPEQGFEPLGNGQTYRIWLNRDGSQAILSRQRGGSWLYSPVPTLVGSGVVGTSLSVNPGSWDSGVALAYQWLRNGSPIVGQVGPEYLVSASDFGSSISVSVSGSRLGYSAAERVSSLLPVVAGTQSRTPAPTLVGSGVVGTSLSVNPGSWDSGVALAYQWLRNGSPIVGQVGPEYLVSASDFGSSISVSVSGSQPGYIAVTQISVATSVTPMVMKNQIKPKISGVARVGSTLKAITSKWSPTAQISYNWTVEGRQILGANRQTFKLLPSYKKKLVSVVVTQICQGCKIAKQVSASIRVL